MVGEAQSTWDRPLEENELFFKEISNVIDIKTKLDDACETYCSNNKIKNVKVTQMWANNQRKYSFLMPHHHGEKSILSGVVYLKVDELSFSKNVELFKKLNLFNETSKSIVKQDNYEKYVFLDDDDCKDKRNYKDLSSTRGASLFCLLVGQYEDR